ncbi:MAG: metal-dependent hydrolase [Planctomycetota bacterium]
MDNITHTLCGLALARATFPRGGRLVTATVVVSANLPDLDIVTGLWGRPEFLLQHRGFTHSLLGSGIQAFLVALVMLAVGRWLARRREGGTSPGYSVLLGAAALGLTSHFLLDYTNVYGVRPWLPFNSSWVYGDMAFIVDPWIWLMLSFAAALAAPPSRWGIYGWWILAAFGAWALVFSPRVSWTVALLWILGMLPILWIRSRGHSSAKARLLASGGLLSTLVYLLILLALSLSAKERGVEILTEHVGKAQLFQATSNHPGLAVPWTSQVFAVTEEKIYRLELNLLSGPDRPVEEISRNLSEPALAKIKGTAEYRAWQSFARYPFVGRYQDEIILSDARYDWSPIPSWCSLSLAYPEGTLPGKTD